MTSQNGISIKNIYYMLSYAYRSLSKDSLRSMASENFENIVDMFSVIIASEMGSILKKGLFRTYVGNVEKLPVVRGKICIADTMRGLSSNERTVVCEYDEFSENNIYNQIAKTAIFYLLKQDNVRKENKESLRRLLPILNGVSLLEPKSIRWDTVRIGRETQNYRFIIVACNFVLNGLLMAENDGSYVMRDYLDEQRMHHLYEKFILEYYRYHYPMLCANPSAIKWDLDDDFSDFLPKMQTDITLKYKGKTLIIDAKYYANTMQQQFNHYSVHSGNLYQIFTYVKNADAACTGNVAGVLLYAKTNELITPNQTYHMSGNEISVKSLDLNVDFSIIASSLNSIAEKTFCL